ncbi:MAG: ligase [Chloroflexi bacterium]|nr:MAG: ligase [Chloroflexota bacterium]
MNEPEFWRLLPFHRGDSAGHIQSSDALVRVLPMPTLWWHAAQRNTLILGAGQRDTAPGASPVRRSSGGTAVWATPEVLGLDVALPHGHRLAPADIVEGYRWLGETWVEALRLLDIQGRTVSIAEAREAHQATNLTAEVRGACFGGLSPYEVVVDGRKIVGFAQVRRQRGVLLQAGLHLRFDAEGLAAQLGGENPARLSAALRQRATGVEEVSGSAPSPETVQAAFRHALRNIQQIELREGAWSEEELHLMERHASV